MAEPRWYKEARACMLRAVAAMPGTERRIASGLLTNHDYTDGLMQAMLGAAEAYIGKSPDRVGAMLTGMVGLSIAWAGAEIARGGGEGGKDKQVGG